MYKLSLTIDGDLLLEVFQEAVSDFAEVLREVDKSISGAPSVRWRLSDLRYGSPATITCIGEPRSAKTKDAAELPAIIGETILFGMEQLEQGRGRPEGFTDDALDAAKRLVHLKARRNVNRLVIKGEGGKRFKRPKALDLTERLAASVDELIGVKYTVPTSVEGTLETINSHVALYFNVYDSVWGARVHCDIPEALKPKALEAFDKRVLVKGFVTTDVAGRPRHIRVETIEVLPSRGELPQSLRGLDREITEGLGSSEYLKREWA